MSSKRSHEGLLTIDHRDTPGMPDEVMQAQGLPAGSGRGLLETPTYTCSHCPAIVVMNPLRTRARTYCKGCDHYICDRCGAIMAQTKKCKTYKQVLDELQEQNSQHEGVIQHG